MKLIQYNESIVSTMDAEGLVLLHKDISSYSVEYVFPAVYGLRWKTSVPGLLKGYNIVTSGGKVHVSVLVTRIDTKLVLQHMKAWRKLSLFWRIHS